MAAYIAPELRLKDLRAARIANLPTPRRRRTTLGMAAFCAVLTAVGIAAAVSDKPLFGLVAALFALGVLGQIAEAREITAQLRAPRAATHASLGELEWASTGEEVLGGVAGVVLSGGTALIEVGAGKVADRVWSWRGRRKLARRLATAPPPPGETHILTCRASQKLHGPARLLLWPTFGLAAVAHRSGWLTLTDRRLRFRDLSVPLEEVEVLEWFEGSFTEARERVLLLRAGGRTLRLGIDRIWGEEAQWAFDVLASRAARPPAFLAARWSLDP